MDSLRSVIGVAMALVCLACTVLLGLNGNMDSRIHLSQWQEWALILCLSGSLLLAVSLLRP